MITCKNCGNIFEGKFCNNCGQRSDIHKFSIKHILHDFIHNFTHVDSGLFFLIKELFLRPGIVAREYIEGKRKKYFSPIQYLIIGVAVSFFLTVKLGVIGFRQVEPEVLAKFTYSQVYFLQFNNFIYTYFNVLLFLSLPVMAFFSFVFYKRSGYNYSENLIFQTLLAAQRNFIYILLMPLLYALVEKWLIGIGIYYFIFFIYYGFAYYQFYDGNKFWNIMKFILSFIISIIVIQFASMAVFYLFFFKY